jgi:glucose-1-phosphate thymidylyltransferase
MNRAVILAAGLGTRMQQMDDGTVLSRRQEEVAATGCKAMIPLNGQPFLNYIFSALADAGYREVSLVIGPHTEIIREYYQSVELKRIGVTFCVQDEPKGSADALLAAESSTGSSHFLMINSDNYYPVEVLTTLRELDGQGLIGFDAESLRRGGKATIERIANCAFLIPDEEGYLLNLVEKPDGDQLAAIDKPHWVSMTCWRFDRSIYEACRSIGLSERGELEIPDAVGWAIRNLDARFRMISSEAVILDLSSRRGIKPVEEALKSVEVNL